MVPQWWGMPSIYYMLHTSMKGKTIDSERWSVPGGKVNTYKFCNELQIGWQADSDSSSDRVDMLYQSTLSLSHL